MKKALALFLAAAMSCTLLAGCGQDNTTGETTDTGDTAETSDLVYAVEAGSAGEAAANENGWKTNVVASQADALMEVAAGTSDAAIIDLLMAGAMIGEGTDYPDMIHTDELTTEEYGVGCRPDSDLTDFINYVFSTAYADGTMEEIATTYGVQEALVEQPAAEEEFTPAEGGDVAYIQDKGTLVVGITEFEPMDYQDENGHWVGFDADMATLFAESLGVDVEFQLIDWDSKIMELDGKTIDVAWNGMTLTEDVKEAMECSNPYFNNAQVVVVKADQADKYQTVDSIQDLSFSVESGSAGMEQAEAYSLNYTPAKSQANTLLEVASGTSDAAIIDYLMAVASTGEGTSYENLTYTVSLADEQYGVGFRKGSDLAEKLNEFFAEKYADGTMQKVAEKYGIAEKLVEQP